MARTVVFAITGGTGFIGRALVKRLVEFGHEVRVLSRRELQIAGVTFIRGDLSSSDVLNPFVAGVDVVYHCAGEINDVTLMRSLHVDGTKRLLDAVVSEVAQTGKKIHWVQLSSVGVYGPPRGAANVNRTITEASPNYPVGEYEVTKTSSDRLVIDSCINDAISYTILRPSNVFGEGMTNQSLRSLIHIVKRGLFFYIGVPGAVATYVHVNDVVSALLKCGLSPAAKGNIYNLSSDCLLEELVQYISRALKVKQPRLRISEKLIRFIVNSIEPLVTTPLKHSRIDALVKRTHYPSNKIVSDLGFVFSQPMPMGVDGLVRECTANLGNKV